jgi:hypothetical protein
LDAAYVQGYWRTRDVIGAQDRTFAKLEDFADRHDQASQFHLGREG